MYDLSARFPWEKDFRVNRFAAATTGKKSAKDGKENFVGKIDLSGFSPSAKDKELVKELTDSMSHDPHVKPVPGKLTHGANAAAPTVYELKIDVAKQNAKAYATHLTVPRGPGAGLKRPKATPKAAEPLAEEGDDQ